MNKICTSQGQSKKLVELGIDTNTADMYYDVNSYGIQGKPEVAVGTVWKKDIPAWSLTALLGLMPRLYEFDNDPDDGGCQPNLCKGYNNNSWHVFYRSSIYITEWHEDPIDAAFEMVVWLKENRKI